MSKAMKVGDLVEVYRIPKKCDSWVSGMNFYLFRHMTLEWVRKASHGIWYCWMNGYIFPRSCVRRVKGDSHA